MIWKKLIKRKRSFKYILTLCFFLISVIPLVLFSSRLYAASERTIVQLAQENVQDLISSKNRLLDITFAGVREASLYLLVDRQLYHIFDELDKKDELAVMNADKEIKLIFRKYFESYPQVASVRLMTDFYTFGYDNAEGIFHNLSYNGELYEMAANKNGASIFMPSNNIFQQDSSQSSTNTSFNERCFSMVRIANFTLVTNENTSKTLGSYNPKPVLIVSFYEKIFREELGSMSLPEGANYMVFDSDGNIASHSDISMIGKANSGEWLKKVKEAADGVSYMDINGKRTVVCADTSTVTGWTTAVIIPRSSLLGAVIGNIRSDLILFVLLYLSLSILLSLFLIRKLTQSLGNLLEAINCIGEGKFGIEAAHTAITEFDYLVDRFNDMSYRIKRLVEENYLTKLRQKETEIAILTTQLNPHFLYNTLNIIHLSNANGNYERTGKMIIALSRMLNYIVDNYEEQKPLKEDLDWIKRYIYIMQCRYDGAFEVSYDIDEALLLVPVPKLFLQPIIENSILHGFRNREYGGIIKISAFVHSDRLIFKVEDNGDGMTQDELKSLFRGGSKGVGIKNTAKRLKLMYGKTCSLIINSQEDKGTRAIIELPLFVTKKE